MGLHDERCNKGIVSNVWGGGRGWRGPQRLYIKSVRVVVSQDQTGPNTPPARLARDSESSPCIIVSVYVSVYTCAQRMLLRQNSPPSAPTPRPSGPLSRPRPSQSR